MIGYTKISRTAFYNRGGFSNPRLVRFQNSGESHWSYYERG